MPEASQASPVKALACPACGAPVPMRAAGYTVTVVCEHCGSTLDALEPTFALIGKAEEVAAIPRIPLGTRGELDGRLWEVVGYLERETESSSWSEHLLFSPYYGYRFLIDDGHGWSLSELIDGRPATGGDGAPIVDGRRLGLVEPPYEARVSVVIGEFYWRVAVGETVRVTDYAGGGVMLAKEEAGDEVTWARSEPLPRGVAEAAFGLAQGRRGFAAADAPLHARSPSRGLLKPMWMSAGIAMALLLPLMLMAPTRRIGEASLSPTLDGPEQTASIDGLVLSRGHSRVVVHTTAPGLDNQWVDMDLQMVNDATQQSFEGYAVPQFYSGRDSDGSWTEGSRSDAVVFSHVPAGRYSLVVDYSAHTWAPNNALWGSTGSANWGAAASPGPAVQVDVSSGGASGWNVLLAALGIATPPLVATWRAFRAWTKQWSQ
jgi:hypothetical protein